jgi:hypothetical protein
MSPGVASKRRRGRGSARRPRGVTGDPPAGGSDDAMERRTQNRHVSLWPGRSAIWTSARRGIGVPQLVRRAVLSAVSFTKLARVGITTTVSSTKITTRASGPGGLATRCQTVKRSWIRQRIHRDIWISSTCLSTVPRAGSRAASTAPCCRGSRPLPTTVVMVCSGISFAAQPPRRLGALVASITSSAG